MVDGKERKKDPEGRAAAAAAAHSLIRSLDVVKWLVRKCERDNDRLCMTPLGAHNLSCEVPLLPSLTPPPPQIERQRLEAAVALKSTLSKEATSDAVQL